MGAVSLGAFLLPGIDLYGAWEFDCVPEGTRLKHMKKKEIHNLDLNKELARGFDYASNFPVFPRMYCSQLISDRMAEPMIVAPKPREVEST